MTGPVALMMMFWLFVPDGGVMAARRAAV